MTPAADRDWRGWHDGYGDPRSPLSRRLAVVQDAIRCWADCQPTGPLRLLSMCAGQGHDVVGALGGHARRDDVSGLLVELDPHNVEVAAEALAAAGLRGVRAVEGDAGSSASYVDAVPAQLLLVCGVFGNVPDGDVQRTVRALPGLAAEGATVIWTRHRRAPDLTPAIRRWFSDAGFEELAFTSPGADSFAVGTHRLAVDPLPFRAAPLFAFD